MKIMFLPVTLVALALLALPSHSDAGQEMSIQLAPFNMQMRQDSRSGVSLRIVLRNTSSHDVKILEHENQELGESDYVMNVVNINGVQPSLTEYGSHIYGGGDIFVSGTYRSITLQSNQSISTSVRVDKVYDMSQPGTYTASVSRKIDTPAGPRYIRSNEVTFTVTP
jgi:hypothetical protein